jgi:hypothetical protein
MDLATTHGVSYGTMHNTLHDELGLVKKSMQWVPKLLSEEKKKERVRICMDSVTAVHHCSMSMFDNIFIMDKIMVSYHTPETKRQSKQWINKGMPSHVNAKVLASRTRQMMLAFFECKGLVLHTHHPQGRHK